MDNSNKALQRLIQKNKKPQTQRELNMLSVKLFTKVPSIRKVKKIQSLKEDNDLLSHESFLNSIKFDYKRKYTEENCKRAIKLFQNNKRNLNQNQFFIQFLMQLEPFNQIISESGSSEAEDIIRLLSFTLKYEFIPKETPIYKFGEYSNKFYLILNGQVDIIVPNEEERESSEEEYFLYLLKLRQHNEHHLLNKALVRNCNAFFLEEKSFDNWVKIAYNTLQSIKTVPFHQKQQQQNDNQAINHAATFSRAIHINNHLFGNSPIKPHQDLSPSRVQDRLSQMKSSSPNRIHSPRQSPKRKRRQSIIQQELNQKKPIFDSNERKELVKSLESDIINTMRVIDPYFEDEFLQVIKAEDKVSSDEYINRTKPVRINSNYYYVKKKKVIISSYFLANRLYSGDKFGEMMNDVNQINSTNQRVSTIITNKDSEFGVLDKEGYNECLKDAYERIRKIKLNFLLQIKIFRKCNKSLFMKSFSNFFTKRTYVSQETLFTENSLQEDIMSVYFIRDGEFVTEWNKSLNDIDYLINTLKYDWLLPSDDDEDTKSSQALESFMRRKIHWKLQYFTENDVVGLNDALLNRKYLYTVKCSSSQATVYEIHLNFFKMVIALDVIIGENVKEFETIQRNLMIKLLLKQKKQKLEIFKKINKEMFDNEFTYVKKRIVVPKKIHTTINRECKRRRVIDIEKRRSNETNIDIKEENKTCVNNNYNNNTETNLLVQSHIANTISNITFTNKDSSLKSNFPLVRIKNLFNCNEKIESNTSKRVKDNKDKYLDQRKNSSTPIINNTSKTKDYYNTTLESEQKISPTRMKIRSSDVLFPSQKLLMTARKTFNHPSIFLPPSILTKQQETKNDTIFNSLSKTIYKYNKNNQHYSSIDPKLYLMK